MNKYIAFDIGGTSIKYGLIGNDTSFIEHHIIKTPKTLDQMLSIIHEYIRLHTHPDVKGVAVSLPGAVSDEGIIYGSCAIPYIHGPNIKELIASKTNLPVYIENDANCVGYAELWAGAAQNKKDVIVMAIGTGIGGAIIKDGKVHKGANLHGGEFGFMLLNPNLDANGDNWVRMDSTLSMVKKVANAKGIDVNDISGEEVFHLANKGDKDCIQAIEEFIHLLAIGIFNLQYIYDPEIILIGGSISARDDLVSRIYGKLDNILAALPNATIRPQINRCQFRQNANLLGAIFGLKKEIEWKEQE